MRSTNQHYITKSYLNNFCHPSIGQHALYPYRKNGGACKPRGTKQLGSAIDFYVQRINGELNNQLDEMREISERLLFCKDKSHPSPLTKCVKDTEKSFVPDDEAKEHFAGAAAFLHCGSPVQVHNSAMTGLWAMQVEIFNRINAPETLEFYKERFGDAAEAQRDKDRKELLAGELVIDVGNENHKQLGFESFQYQELWMDFMCAMSLTIMHSHHFFITSDNPVILFSRSKKGIDNVGLKMRDAEIWFPISWNKGLLWRWGKHPTHHQTGYSENCVLNRREIDGCYKFVYSPLQSDWLEKTSHQTNFNPLIGYYGCLNNFFSHAKPCYDAQTGELLDGEIIEVFAALKHANKPDILGI
ncbi:MAG: DUF4238 domain-containing protein [Proteobacteria bacterium]|jgi:hypothetical protein|nr:DUF4238 domain-containing protein [Pseudomonadota bacterium]